MGQDMDEKVIAVNVGNTTTKFGLAQAGALEAVLETTTVHSQTADEAFMALSSFLSSVGAQLPAAPFSPSAAHEPAGRDAGASSGYEGIVACVVPSLAGTWTQALSRFCGRRPMVVGPGLKTGLRMDFNDPGEVGADRVADIVAAKHRYGFPTIVVSLGTSTTLELLDDEGRYAGGIIAPGMRISAAALANAAAKLPVVEYRAPAKVVGKCTSDAMQSGIVLGEVARIDGLVDMMWDEAGYETKVVLTGPDAATVLPLLRHEAELDRYLTLDGLVVLHDLNRKRR